jgi:hypothetical protein
LAASRGRFAAAGPDIPASASSKTAAARARASSISAVFDRTFSLPALERDRVQPALVHQRSFSTWPTKRRGGMAPVAPQLLCSLVQG